MTIAKRFTAVALVFVMIFGYAATIASAASSVSFRNVTSKTYTVKTGNAPWYTFSGQKVTVENTGDTSVHVIFYKNGVKNKEVVNLKPNKSHTFRLSANTTYTLALTKHYASTGKISCYISSNKYVKSIK